MAKSYKRRGQEAYLVVTVSALELFFRDISKLVQGERSSGVVQLLGKHLLHVLTEDGEAGGLLFSVSIDTAVLNLPLLELNKTKVKNNVEQ